MNFVSLKTAADLVGLTSEGLRQWVLRDERLGRRFGGRYFIYPETLAAVFDERARELAEKADRLRAIAPNQGDAD